MKVISDYVLIVLKNARFADICIVVGVFGSVGNVRECFVMGVCFILVGVLRVFRSHIFTIKSVIFKINT